MPLGIHPGFLLVLLVIVLIVFGPGKLPDLGAAVGRGIREFRKESDKVLDEVKSPAAEKASSTTTSATIPSTESVETELQEACSEVKS
jgi:sec-independent protein translocase protein TatA